jgi:hypothetical protein
MVQTWFKVQMAHCGWLRNPAPVENGFFHPQYHDVMDMF